MTLELINCSSSFIIKSSKSSLVKLVKITSECLNRHGLFLCPIKDFCDDKSQLDQIKCNICNIKNMEFSIDYS